MSEIIQGYKKELADAKEVSYCLFVYLFMRCYFVTLADKVPTR